MPPATRPARASKATKETKATRETRSTKGGGVSKAKATTPRKEPSVVTEDMTVVQLRAALKKRGLPFDGKKAELVERLTSAPDKAEMTEDTDMQEAARVEPKSEAAAAPSPSVGAAAAEPAPGPSPATETPHPTPVEEGGGAVHAAEVDGAAAEETATAASAPGATVTTPASQVFSPRPPGYEVPPFPAAAAAAAAPVVEEAVEAAAAAAPSILPHGVATEITDVPPEPAAPELPVSMLDTTALLDLPIAGGRAAAEADEEEEAVDVHRVDPGDPGSPRGTGGPTGTAAQVPASGEEEEHNAEPAKGDLDVPLGGAHDETLMPEQRGTRRPHPEPVEDDDDRRELFDATEVYEHLQNISDPEHPYTLEQLNVISEENVQVDDAANRVEVFFTPTVSHCSMATLIGLCIRVQLLRALPRRFKVDIYVSPGSHSSEHAVNKQLNDKERVAAALENPTLQTKVNLCLSGKMAM